MHNRTHGCYRCGEGPPFFDVEPPRRLGSPARGAHGRDWRGFIFAGDGRFTECGVVETGARGVVRLRRCDGGGEKAWHPADLPCRVRAEMILVTRLVATHSDRPAGEQIALRAERRLFLKRRWRGVAEDGTEFGFDLESRLRSGGVIHRTEQADWVVWQEPEPVLVLRPATPEEAALMGWKLGNLHMPVEVLPGVLRVLPDPAVSQLLEREGWPFSEETVLFQPLKVAAHAVATDAAGRE